MYESTSFIKHYRSDELNRSPVSKPVDLIQLDTLDIRPLPDVALKPFTAWDVVSKYIIDFVLTNLWAISPFRSALNATYKMKEI